MDNIRFGLLCAAAVICFFLYQAWQEDYSSAEHGQTAQHSSQQHHSQADDDDVPDIEDSSSDKELADDDSADEKGKVIASGDRIHVLTDKLDVVIDTRGGSLRRVALRGIAASKDQHDKNLLLLSDELPDFFIEQSGLVSNDKDSPTHNSTFKADQDEYELGEDEDKLRVPLTWTDDKGHKVTKTYTFHRDSYKIELSQKAENKADKPWELAQYVRYWRTPKDESSNVPFSHAFFGVGWYQNDGDDSFAYQQRSRDELADDSLSEHQKGGWIAMVEHYFTGAVIPPEDDKVRLFAQPKDIESVSGAYEAGFIGQQHTVDTDDSHDFVSTLFVGPKYQDALGSVADGLDLTVDYGWFSILARPIFWVLNKLHSVVGNWGVAIILLTVLIKALFYKLSEIQFRGMARMRKFQPRIQRLKEQYGDDRAELQKRMMELYKKEGFNPMAGCWPLLVQMPVFIALYWVLRESVELRHAPFMLWIQDLSAPDPYFILPILFGLIMFLQQRLNTTMAMDPMQQRVMQIMPIGMAVFFTLFPAGLVLYWCTNSLLTIAQQWYIYRKLDKEGLGRDNDAANDS